MADAALFIGWGQVVRGREKRALQVFNESVGCSGRAPGDGKIEDFEVVILTPHGGDLQGFALLRGSEDRSRRCARTRSSSAASRGRT